MSTDSAADQTYYGQPLGPRQLVMQMQGANQGADPLREVLTRNGSRRVAEPQPGYAPPQQQPGYAPPYPQYQSQGAPPQGTPPGQGYMPPPPSQGGRGPVQEQSLAPPR